MDNTQSFAVVAQILNDELDPGLPSNNKVRARVALLFSWEDALLITNVI